MRSKGLIAWMLVPAALMLMSCRAKMVSVPVEHTVRVTDTVYQERLRVERDTVRELQMTSVMVRDSIAPNVDSTGRVTGYDRWHWETRDGLLATENARLRLVNDSLRQSAATVEVCEVPVEVETIREVPARLSWWQQTQIWCGRLLMAALAAAGIYTGVRLRRRL